jgi:amidohydrolase
MPVLNRIAGFAPEMSEWRQWLHLHPELAFDLPETSAFVAQRLRDFGVDEIHEGIATSGIVALIHGKEASDAPAIGLRADMDALPIMEATGLEYASENPGRMHACGHDGHTTMLLGAARYLAETRNFSGTVALIFQPAEEEGGGAGVMVKEGVMERFNIGQVYGLHNRPNVPLGDFQTSSGPLLAAVDTFDIHIEGQGGHAARPHQCVDPVVAAASMVMALQTIVSRNVPPMEKIVISVTQIHTGSKDNIVPQQAYIQGTVRSYSEEVQALVMRRMREIVDGQAASFGVSAKLEYATEYPATVNHPEQARLAADVASALMGEDRVERETEAEMGAEDFAYFLKSRPGAYLFLGQGESAGLHHPEYNFNDEVAPVGASFFAHLVEKLAPAG